jgi:hypothetical protein
VIEQFFQMVMFMIFAKFVLNDMAHAFGLAQNGSNSGSINVYKGFLIIYHVVENWTSVYDSVVDFLADSPIFSVYTPKAATDIIDESGVHGEVTEEQVEELRRTGKFTGKHYVKPDVIFIGRMAVDEEVEKAYDYFENEVVVLTATAHIKVAAIGRPLYLHELEEMIIDAEKLDTGSEGDMELLADLMAAMATDQNEGVLWKEG